jgi:hypothetical protein
MRRIILAATSIALLSGCEMFSDQYHMEEFRITESGPIQGKPSSVPGLALDAKQRIVISPTIPSIEPVGFDSKRGIPTYGIGERQVVCTEPSPDSLSALATELAAKAKASGGAVVGGGADGGAELSFERSVTETVKALGERTQTIQLMRDTLFRACEGYANGGLDTFGYAVILGAYERLTTQWLGIDALRTVGGAGGSGKLAQITAIRKEMGNFENRLVDLDGQIGRVSRRAAAAETGSAEKAALDDTLAALRTQRAGVVNGLTKLSDSLVTKVTEGGDGKGSSTADGIVALAALPANDENASYTPIVAGCMMWFARNPGIRVNFTPQGLPVLPQDSPAIAGYCAALLARSFKDKPATAGYYPDTRFAPDTYFDK